MTPELKTFLQGIALFGLFLANLVGAMLGRS
jgi:hypothetical protein